MEVEQVLTRCYSVIVRRVKALVAFVDRVRWRIIPMRYRPQLDRPGPFTPVYKNGDFDPFDVVAWKLRHLHGRDSSWE